MTKDEILEMLYRACCLYNEQCHGDTPDWIRIICNCNPEFLEDAAEIAREDDTWEESWHW